MVGFHKSVGCSKFMPMNFVSLMNKKGDFFFRLSFFKRKMFGHSGAGRKFVKWRRSDERLFGGVPEARLEPDILLRTFEQGICLKLPPRAHRVAAQ